MKKKIGELWSTTNKVISVYVYLPEVNNALCAYTNAFEFGPRDFGAGEILPSLLIFPSLTWGAGRTHVGLCPKFLVIYLLYLISCATAVLKIVDATAAVVVATIL